MKKLKLARSLMAAGSVVALSAVLYGCAGGGGGGEDAANLRAMDAEDALAALNVAAMAQLGEDGVLTPETYAEIIAGTETARQAAVAAAVMEANRLAEIARMEAVAAAVMGANGLADIARQEAVAAAVMEANGLAEAN